MEELTGSLNATMLSTHRVDDDKTKTIDEMQQHVSVYCTTTTRYPYLFVYSF